QANWGDGAKNAFRGLFDRVRRCDDEAIGQFRAFCQPFTGFRLYEMTIAGEPPDDLSGYTDARIALNLERNLPYVDQWLSLPRHPQLRRRRSPGTVRPRHQYVVDERDERRTGALLHPADAEVLAKRGRGVFRTEPRQPDNRSVERPRPHRRGLVVSSHDRDAL